MNISGAGSSCFLYMSLGLGLPLRQELLGDDYEIQKVATCPSDVGYFAVSRPRNYWVLAHKGEAHFLQPVAEVYEKISNQLSHYRDVTIEHLFWESDPSELRRERLGSSSKSQEPKDGHSWQNQLSSFERKTLEKYMEQWRSTHDSMEEAVFVLNQNPDVHRSWTRMKAGEPGRLPTLRLS